MTLDELQKLCENRHPSDIEELVARVPRLIEVARAAKDEAVFWNEGYCTGDEHAQMEAARKRLADALVGLEAP